MKTIKFYTGISLLATLLLFSGCGKELDELPAGGSGTESPENPEQTEGELLHLRVSDAGYLDADAGSRATDSGLTTTFEDGDKIGLFVVNNENEVLYANVPYTKSGEEWTAEQNVRTKGYPVRVFAYYPYVGDAEITGKVDVTAQDASVFFKTYTDELDISNQSTPELYRQADVMACMVEIKDKEAARDALILKMNHLMGLVVVKLPETVTVTEINYYLKGDEDFTWKIVQNKELPANLSNESFTVTDGTMPLEETTGYRYVCKNNISFSGDFTTYEAEKNYTIRSATVTSGSSKTYNVSVLPFVSTAKIEYIPQVGDFYMRDGSILPNVSDSNKKDCVGIVCWVPTEDDTLEKRNAAWLDTHPNCTHGLVVGLHQTNSAWSNVTEVTGLAGKEKEGFIGYVSTQELFEKYSGYTIVNIYSRLKDDLTDHNSSTDWYIPSVDELLVIHYHYSYLNSSLSILGGLASQLSNEGYWTSAENNASCTFDVNLYNGNIDGAYPKGGTQGFTRLILAF